MNERMTPKKSRSRRGSALPAILALSIGVGALAAGFTVQNHREHRREQWEKDRMEAYLDAWAQMESVTEIVNQSPYDAGTGENIAMREAAARGDMQFIDRDGYPCGVTCEADGATGSGFFRLVSLATVNGARCRITALVRSRQSFADFDYFVNSHDLGISGGSDSSSRHIDAPDGDIHSNRRLLVYFPDKHFVKPVTAVEGFSYMAGAVGPNPAQGQTQNNWFWGPTNDAASSITGLTDVDLTTFGARADNLLNLPDVWDWAKVRLKGTAVQVEHWEYGHNETQPVQVWTEQFHYETQQQEVLQAVQSTNTWTEPVYTQQTVSVYGPVAHQRLVTAAWSETVTRTRQEARQRWVEGGGGGATGGTGGTGGVGYWETYYVTVTYTETVNHPAVYQTYYVNEWHNETQWVQTGTRTVSQTVTNYVSYSPKRYQDVQVRVSDGWSYTMQDQPVWIDQRKVTTYNLGSNGTIFVEGKIEMPTMSSGSHGFDVHTLDGSLTLATNDKLEIRDSIRYAKQDANGVWQTAYLNGADRTQEYIPNTNYTGRSVLGLIARNDVLIRSDVPDQAEINGTILCKEGDFQVTGVNVNSSTGAVTTSSSGSYVKMSLRRLGGIISNERPVTTYVDSNNAVTRGFVFAKSIYDTRQRTNPPRGFPTMNRPRVIATMIREIN